MEQLNWTDEQWYDSLFTNTERKRLNLSQRTEIIKKSMECAENIAQEMLEDGIASNIEKQIQSFGTKIHYNDSNHSDTVIASYDSRANELTVYLHSVETLTKLIEQYPQHLHLSQSQLLDLILAHELYHILEMNRDDIYTYQKLYKKSFLMFSKFERIITASEIGAFHFSKLITNITFCPCLIGHLTIGKP